VSRPALFLDRDGVINVDHGHVGRKEEFDFIPGIFELVRAANAADYAVLVVTNQAGIGRGLYSECDFRGLTAWMMGEFEAADARIDCVYYCPYHPQHGIGVYRRESTGRKPSPGMFARAALDWHLDFPSSIMVGDKTSDLVAASAVGITNLYLFGSTTPMSNACQNLELIHSFRQLLPCIAKRTETSTGLVDLPVDRIICVD
jgi:D-glycero-D-manno-heptose 1,7-bisphosphate phosphatase